MKVLKWYTNNLYVHHETGEMILEFNPSDWEIIETKKITTFKKLNNNDYEQIATIERTNICRPRPKQLTFSEGW